MVPVSKSDNSVRYGNSVVSDGSRINLSYDELLEIVRCLSILRMSLIRLFLVLSYILVIHRYWKHRLFGDSMVHLVSVGCWYSDFFAPR